MVEAKIVSLVPKASPTKVNQDALEMAEALVERIKSGLCIDLAVVEVHSDGGVMTGYSAGSEYHRLTSGAARLAARLATD